METRKINKEIPESNLPCEFKAKSQLRNALRYNIKFKIIQVWADDKICNAHSDSLVLLWRRQWLDMTTHNGQGRTGTEQGRDRAELSKTGVGLWLNEATTNWSDTWWSDDTKRTRIPSMAGSKGERSARGRRAKSKAGRQKPLIVFSSPVQLQLPLALFFMASSCCLWG